MLASKFRQAFDANSGLKSTIPLRSLSTFVKFPKFIDAV
jgi:hypothetical protein